MSVRHWLLTIGLLAAIIVGVIIFLLFPFFAGSDYIGPEHLKEILLTQIEKNFGRKVEVGKVRLKLFPRIQLELFDLTVYDLNSSQAFLKAQHADFILRFLPLLRREVVGKRLFIDQPELFIRRNHQGRWNFLDVSDSSTLENRSIGNPLRQILLVQEMRLNNGRMQLIDEFRSDGGRLVELHTLNFIMLAEPSRQTADLNFAATVQGGEGTSSLTMAGVMQQIPSETRISPASPEGEIPTFQFEGNVQGTNLRLRQVADFFGPRPIPERIQGAINLEGDLRIIPGVVGYDVVVSNMKADMHQLTMNGQVSLSGLLTAQPTFALTFSSSQITIGEGLDLFPAEWIHPTLPTVIAERDIGGSVSVVTATVTGIMNPEARLSLTGEFKIHDAHGIVDGKGTKAEQVSGTLLLDPDRMKIMELSGKYGKMDVGAGKALISFGEADPLLNLELKGTMLAVDLLPNIDASQLFQSTRLTRAWKNLRDIKGTMQVTFRLKGPLSQPELIRYVGADFSPMDVSFQTSLVPQPISGLNGRLALSEQGAQFESLRGWLGATPFSLQGTITGKSDKTFENFTVTARPKSSEILELLPLSSSKKPMPQGTVDAVMSLTGSVEAPKFKGTLDLTNTDVFLSQQFRKPLGEPATLELRGTLSKQAIPFLKQIDLVLPSLRLTGRGTIRLDDRFGIDAAFGISPISLTQVPTWLRPTNLGEGKVEVSLDVKGKGKDWTKWLVTGWVAVTNGVLQMEGLPGPIHNMNLRVKLIPQAAELKLLSFNLLDSNARVTGVVGRWQTDPTLVLKAESSRLNIDLLIPKEERSPIRDFLEDLAENNRVTIRADIENGYYKRLNFSKLTGRVTIGQGMIDIDRLRGKSLSGQVEGRLVIRLPKQQPASTESAVMIAGLPFEQVLSLISSEPSPINGRLFLTGNLQGNGSQPGGVSKTLNGGSELRIEKGRIFRDDSRAIWKIISLLHLPALLQGKVDLNKDGLPFDKITSTVTVQEGRMTSENIVVDSPVIKMTGAGTYDIRTDNLDFIVAVSPFGPYTSLLKSIPLFGRLIQGDRRGVATALFKVKGPLDDPKVDYMPVRSFSSGIGGLAKLALDVLVNAVKMPAELIMPKPNNKEKNLGKVPEIPPGREP